MIKCKAQLTRLDEKKLNFLDQLIDERCEMYGVYDTIFALLKDGFTSDDLIEMNFESSDIEDVLANEDFEEE